VIVAGDFNTSPWSPHFRELLAEAGLRNAAEGHGWIATWPSWFWPARVPIDHVLVGGRLGAASLERGPHIGSDHYPVVADLRLSPG
jgi:endonuclease/exonuclease/phosphatase (EEP) superfamily protein YafD